MNTITNFAPKLIKNIAGLILIIITFSIQNLSAYQGKMINPTGIQVTLHFAITDLEQQTGLSNLKPSQFNQTEGMLFLHKEMGPRKFWMPETYFNLDIIFLDQNLKIVGIEKDVKAHPGMKVPPAIQETAIYNAQYILETKSKSPFSKNLKKGDQLKFFSSTSLAEIILDTHLGQ